MKIEKNTLSPIRLNRLRAQGFTCENEKTLGEMAFGIRFAYRACVVLLIVAIATKSIALFSVMLSFAFLGIVLPNHPFDYFYNYSLRRWLGTPKVPVRSMLLKFACIIATLFLGTVVSLLYFGMVTEGLIIAGILTVFALFPSAIDLCIPSLIYNAIFQKEVKPVS
ncbi:MAG: DUF4395 family protein [Cyclobacteriaceae bacterium]